MNQWHKSFFEVCDACRNRGLVLYGAGIWGDIAFELFRKYGIVPLCYADDDKQKHGHNKNGRIIVPLGEAAKRFPDAVYIPCIDDFLNADKIESKNRDQMIDNLRKLGLYSAESSMRIRFYVFLLDIDINIEEKQREDADFYWKDLQKVILFNNMSNSGSFYVEQLLDNHSHMLFLPYSGSFKMAYDNRLVYLDGEELIVEIMAQLLGYFHSKYEDYDSVGQHRYQKFILNHDGRFNKNILVDPQKFMVCLLKQFEGMVKLQSYGQLIKVLFAAFANATDRKKENHNYWIFYHMHLPNVKVEELLEEFQENEFERIENLIVIREPVQHLYSWIRRFVKKEKNYKAVYKCGFEKIIKSELGIMLEKQIMDDRVRAVCFEDLKQHTVSTMKNLCKWLDIPYENCLLETTIMGQTIYFPANTPDGVKYITGNDLTAVKQQQFTEVLSLWDEVRLNIIYGKFKQKYGYTTSVPAFDKFNDLDWLLKERFQFCDIVEDLLRQESLEDLYDVDEFVKGIYKEYLHTHSGQEQYYEKIHP